MFSHTLKRVFCYCIIMQRILAASSSASVAWQCLISQIGFKFVNSESLWSGRPYTIYVYFIHMYIRMYACMYVLSLVLCALQFWQSSLQSSSQKVKRVITMKPLRLPVAAQCAPLDGLPYCPSYLAASVHPWAHSSLGSLLSFLSMCLLLLTFIILHYTNIFVFTRLVAALLDFVMGL